jgi:hypothetical protein
MGLDYTRKKEGGLIEVQDHQAVRARHVLPLQLEYKIIGL